MSHETYVFFESNVIPSVAREDGGEGHSGLIAIVDTEIQKVIATNFDTKEEEGIVPPDTNKKNKKVQ
jgi:hypothetical protein